MPLGAYYSLGQITAFVPGDGPGVARCIAPAHTLQVGEPVQLTFNSFILGVFSVNVVGEGFFEIEADITILGSTGNWQRVQPDLRHWILTAPVMAFSQSDTAGHTFCNAPGHGLRQGDQVAIYAKEDYNGQHNVVAVTDEGFEVDVDFEGSESHGRWMRAGRQTDPYSLQLTFMLPSWVARYQQNPALRKFVENVIREETPAHITVYIQWLEKVEMQQFDQAFQQFLTTISQRNQ